jgi:hypothetical protein
MSRPTLQIFAAAAALAVLALSFAACGSSGASQEELDRARREGIAKARQQAKIEGIEKQLKSLKKNGHAPNAANPTAPPSGSVPSSSGSTSCGGSLSVGANTTCGFAANVEADYYAEIGSGSGTVYSYSPTTGQYYSMYCSAGAPHVCTGGNDASVYFP